MKHVAAVDICVLSVRSLKGWPNRRDQAVCAWLLDVWGQFRKHPTSRSWSEVCDMDHIALSLSSQAIPTQNIYGTVLGAIPTADGLV